MRRFFWVPTAYVFVCLFDVPVNKCSVLSGWAFLDWTINLRKDSCSRTQRSDADEVRTRGPLGLQSSTLPLSHCAPYKLFEVTAAFHSVSEERSHMLRIRVEQIWEIMNDITSTILQVTFIMSALFFFAYKRLYHRQRNG